MAVTNIQQSVKPKYYRPDIDGLRAIAVLSVVLYHAFPNVLRGGFIGVDIFFVISGFLISGILYRNLLSDSTPGSVRLLNFYERRVRRIFPVLIVVLLSTLVAGFLLLTPEELKTLGKHIAGGAGYVSNLVLWSEAGYFDQTATLKPLLHLWSLGVEEQFYIVWPLLLWLLYKTRLNFLTSTLIFTVVSFILCMKGISRDPTATFYAPWTRVWELSTGGVLAWIVMNCHMRESWLSNVNACLSRIVFRGNEIETRAWRDVLSILGAICLIVGLCTIKHSSRFPSWNALLPVMGAVFIIGAGADAWFNRAVLANRVAVFIGLISYPLYLWHWPLLSFEHILWGGNPPSIARGIAMASAIILAWITYKFVEPPLRYGKYGTIKSVILFFVVVAIGVGGYTLYKSNGFPERVGATKDEQIAQTKFDEFWQESKGRCETKFPDWTRQDNKCLLQKPIGENTIAVIGDSHAGHLFAGLTTANSKYSFEVFPGSCGVPFLDVSSFSRVAGRMEEIRSVVYLRHREAYKHITEDPNVRVVLLAHNPGCSGFDVIDRRNPNEKDIKKILTDGLVRTLDMLQQANKKVIIVLDNPSLPFNPSRCVKRPMLSEFGASCKFDRKNWEDREYRKVYEKITREVSSKYNNVHIIDLTDQFCNKDTCSAANGKEVLYRDDNHLNMAGSKIAAQAILKVIDAIF